VSATVVANAWVLTALEAHGITPAPLFPAKTTGIGGVAAFAWNFRCGDRSGSYCTSYASLTNRDVQIILDLAGVRVDLPLEALDGVEHPLLMKRVAIDDVAALPALAADTESLFSVHRDAREAS
jgi:hypothetical protein